MSAMDTALYTALAMDLICLVTALQGLCCRLLKESAYGCTMLIVFFAGLLVDELMKAQLETQTAPPPAASVQAPEAT